MGLILFSDLKDIVGMFLFVFFLYFVIYKINLYVFVYKKKVVYVRELRYKFVLILSFRDVIIFVC